MPNPEHTFQGEVSIQSATDEEANEGEDRGHRGLVRIGVDIVYAIGSEDCWAEYAACRFEKRNIDQAERQAIAAGSGLSGDYPALVDLVIARVRGAFRSDIDAQVSVEDAIGLEGNHVET